MALFISRADQYRSRERVPSNIGVRNADLRPSSAENQAIGRLGRLLVLRGEEMQQERDAAVVGEMYNNWRDADRQMVSELFKRKGKDAIGLDQEYDKFFNKSQGELDGQAENGNQQTMINDLLSRKRENSLDILARYQVTESESYKSKQTAGIIANAKLDVESARFDDQAVVEKGIEVNNWLNFAYPGRSEEEKEAQEAEIKKELLSANMVGRIDEDATKALETLEKWKGQLGENYVPLKKDAKVKQKQQLINTLQAELEVTKQKNGEPNFGAMRVSITSKKGITNDVKFEVRNWIDAYEAQYTNKKKSDFNSAALAEDQEIGNAYIDGDYAKVLRLIRQSRFLTGSEKKTWKNAITEKNKSINVPISRGDQAEEILEIQDMIANPAIGYQEIRNYIVRSNKLSNPAAELKALESRYKSENKKSIDKAHKYIKDLIIPTRSPRLKVLRHTIENERVVESRTLLDSWIRSQQREGGKTKFLTEGEIMQQAREIATINKPSVVEIQDAIKREKELEQEELE